MNNVETTTVNIVEEGKTLTINVYNKREYISNILQINREFYEFYVLRYMKNMYPKHKSIVDIGSNIGNHAIYYGNFLEHENIYCFEPFAPNFEILKKNVTSLRCIAYNCALGATRGKCKIIEPKEENCGMIKTAEGTDIDMMPLDNFDIQDVTLIKIDVEGSEYNVLLGALRTILKFKPPIFIETADDRVMELMKLLGYVPRKYFYEGDASAGDVATIEFIYERNHNG